MTKFTKRLTLATLIIICIVCCLSIVLLEATNTLTVANAADVATDSINGQYDDYTDSDAWIYKYGVPNRYQEDLIATTVTINNFKLTVNEDDPIINIIPKDLFFEEGKHLYIGREYGFFINTEKQRHEYLFGSVWNANFSNNNKISTVLVFDITTLDNFADTIDEFIVKVSPIFQYKFAALTSVENKYYMLGTNGKLTKEITYNVSEETVVPIGTVSNSNNINYEEVEDYYLKDVSFAASLFNEQGPNDAFEEDNYDIDDDEGSFIVQYDYSYNGFAPGQIDGEEIAELTVSSISYILGFAAAFIPGGTLVSGLLTVTGLVTGVPGFAIGMQNLVNALDPEDVVLNSNKVTAIPLYKSYAEQKQHYEHLTKQAGIAVNTDSNTKLWYKNGNFASANFSVSNAANNYNEIMQTRIIREIGICVIDSNGEYQTNNTSKYSFINGEPVKEEIKLEKENKVFLLNNGKNYFEFTAEYPGVYDVKIGSETTLNVKVDDISVNGSANKFSTFLNAGKHSIEVSNNDSSVRNMPISVMPSENLSSVSVSGLSEFLVQYRPMTNAIRTISISNARIEDVFVLNENGMLQRIDFLDNFILKSRLDVAFNANEIYYILIKNLQTESINVDITIADIEHTLSIGSNNISVEKDDNYRYCKFIASSNGTNTYTFLFSGIMSNTELYNFYVCDENGRNYENITQYSYGYLAVNSLTKDQCVYIGIKSNADKNLNVSVTASAPVYNWKVYQGTLLLQSGEKRAVELTRGKDYRFELWLSDTTKVRLIDVNNLGDKSGLTVNNVTGVISISSDRKHKSKFVVRGVCEQDSNYTFAQDLTVTPVFDVKEFSLNSKINYVNATEISWEMPSEVRCVNYTVTGTTTFSATTIGTKIDILPQLIKAKANTAEFEITSIIVGQDQFNINKKLVLNCKHSYITTTGKWIVKTYYHITNALQFYNIRLASSNFYKLDNDISLAGFYNYSDSWRPIDIFTGYFDGQEHTISDLRIKIGSDLYQGFDGSDLSNEAVVANHSFGLFGYNQGMITNFNVDKFLIQSTTLNKGDPGWLNIGVIAGTNAGMVSLCNVYDKNTSTNDGTRSIEINRNRARVGGIVGDNVTLEGYNGTVHSCNVGASGKKTVLYANGDIGGIVGRNCSIVTICVVDNVEIQLYTSNANRSAGGIVGYSDSGTISEVTLQNSKMVHVGHESVNPVAPAMGYAVGAMHNTTYYNLHQTNNTYELNGLNENQRKYCFNNGTIGKFLGRDDQGNKWDKDKETGSTESDK